MQPPTLLERALQLKEHAETVGRPNAVANLVVQTSRAAASVSPSPPDKFLGTVFVRAGGLSVCELEMLRPCACADMGCPGVFAVAGTGAREQAALTKLPAFRFCLVPTMAEAVAWCTRHLVEVAANAEADVAAKAARATNPMLADESCVVDKRAADPTVVKGFIYRGETDKYRALVQSDRHKWLFEDPSRTGIPNAPPFRLAFQGATDDERRNSRYNAMHHAARTNKVWWRWWLFALIGGCIYWLVVWG
jgi:hypothetical protein